MIVPSLKHLNSSNNRTGFYEDEKSPFTHKRFLLVVERKKNNTYIIGCIGYVSRHNNALSTNQASRNSILHRATLFAKIFHIYNSI